jgi:hypothetical protein
MKILLLASLLALASAPSVLAQQAPGAATVKTKVKPAGQASVKTKTTPAPPTEAFEAPSDAIIDAKANGLTTNMQQNLGLSPQQVEKVRAINRRAVEMVETARARYRTEPRKVANVVETAGRSRLELLKDVLTPAQFAKYQRKREEKMGIPNGQGPVGNAAPGLRGEE